MKELLIDTMIFEVTPTMLKEAKNQHGRFLVNGVLQRANAKNQNGRVYPKDILNEKLLNIWEEKLPRIEHMVNLTIQSLQ